MSIECRTSVHRTCIVGTQGYYRYVSIIHARTSYVISHNKTNDLQSPMFSFTKRDDDHQKDNN